MMSFLSPRRSSLNEEDEDPPDSATSLSSASCSFLSFFIPHKLTIQEVCQKIIQTPTHDKKKLIKLLDKFFELFMQGKELNEEASVVFWIATCFYTGRRIHVLTEMTELSTSLVLSSSEEWNPLHAACYRGYAALVTLLIDAGADINCSCRGVTPLHIAVRFSLTNIVELLLNKNANPNIADSKGFTPIFNLFNEDDPPKIKVGDVWRPSRTVVGENKLSILKNLIESKADYRIKDLNGMSVSDHMIHFFMSFTPESFPVTSYYMKRIHFDKHANYNGTHFFDAIMNRISSDDQPPCVFWRDNLIPFLEDLLAHGVFPESQISSREIFSFAVASRRTSFKLLAGLMISNAQKADCFDANFLNFPSFDVSPLQAACFKGDKKLLDKLLSVPLNFSCCHNNSHDHRTPTPIQIAVMLCNPSLILRLLKAGAATDCVRLNNGPNLLQLACSYMGDEKGIALLLEGHRLSFCHCPKSCDTDEFVKDTDMTAYRKTWMYGAIKDRFAKICDADRYHTVKLLLDHGLKAQHYQFGVSPMEIAFRDEQYPAIHALLDSDPTLANSSFQFRTPLMYAIDSWTPWSTHYNIIYELLKAGADTKVWNDSLIHTAIQVIIKHLNSRRGSPNASSEDRAFF